MVFQRTIAKTVELEGRGLFTGSPAIVRFHPAEAGSGITFMRTDQPQPVRIQARVENVTKRARRTSLRNGTVSIETVEHVLSACLGMQVDNLLIELSGDEVPAADGSCMPFVEKLQEAGFDDQEGPRQAYTITDTMRVVEGDCELVALPPLNEDVHRLEIHYDLDYGTGGPIGRQRYSVIVSPDIFVREIAPARTFVLKREADQLLASGLGTHLTYEDILVFGEDGPIENELRFADECVRHKILDLIGDMYLLGRPIIGRIYARKSGHALNHSLVRAFRQRIEENERARMLVAKPDLDVRQVQRTLPHRYPFLMVDRIVELQGTERAVGIKNITINEPYFQGHYPGQPIMPGVLIIEAMAQMGGILLSQELEHKGKVAVLLSLDKVKFRRTVGPGDQLVLIAETIRVKSRSGHVRTLAKVGGDVVAEAIIKFVLTDA
ncbi:MAG: UDP-3-O-acyl-N-acetylglucosamine deacetylase [Phycisphaerae bacterium]